MARDCPYCRKPIVSNGAMCNYKVLHNNQHGYVVRCGNCGYVQVAFGTTLIALTLNQFTRFRKLVEDQEGIHRDEPCPNAKCIHMPTPARNMTLVYTIRELRQLQELLNQADACLQVERLMSI